MIHDHALLEGIKQDNDPNVLGFLLWAKVDNPEWLQHYYVCMNVTKAEVESNELHLLALL